MEKTNQLLKLRPGVYRMFAEAFAPTATIEQIRMLAAVVRKAVKFDV